MYKDIPMGLAVTASALHSILCREVMRLTSYERIEAGSLVFSARLIAIDFLIRTLMDTTKPRLDRHSQKFQKDIKDALKDVTSILHSLVMNEAAKSFSSLKEIEPACSAMMSAMYDITIERCTDGTGDNDGERILAHPNGSEDQRETA